MAEQMINPGLKVIAGPDSLDEYNIDELYRISEIKVNDRYAVMGARTVGLKSRTNFDKQNSDAGFMGHDFNVIMRNFNIFGNGGNKDDLRPLPSVDMAAQLYEDTGMMGSTEIVLPAIQMACLAKSFKFKPFMVWNPAVDQLGWHVRQMAGFADELDWVVGIKNGKWLGEEYELSETPDFQGRTSIEVAWDGHANYASIAPETVLIQRGCDLPNKGEYRNLPIHYAARRTKLRHQDRKLKMYFDPSHSLGPKMRDQIVAETVKAMKMKVTDNEYLYDGILIEVGTARCDTHQHITVRELQDLIEELAQFRTLEANNRH
jgi:hypothetical protein